MSTSIENSVKVESPLLYSQFVDGSTCDTVPIGDISNNDDTIAVVSPAFNKPVLYFKESSIDDVNNAISSAYKAFHDRDSNTNAWSHPSQVTYRANILASIGNLLRANTKRLADLETKQIGRPCKEMRFQLSRLPEWFDYYSSLLRVHEDTVKPFGGNSYINIVRRVPLGVIAQITPWNHPLLITIKKLAPAIAAGNTVVVKPSPLAPASIIELAKLCTEAGLPNGVFNVILGGQTVGEQLINDTRISKIDFTGGPKAGKKIGEAAGSNLCSVTQELGGKAPMIVFGPPWMMSSVEGADTTEAINEYLDPIVNGVAFGAFIASGQTCIAGTRILVESTVYEQFKKKIVDKVGIFKLGNPEHVETTIGPVITSEQIDFIQKSIDDDLSSEECGPKLELLCGGKRYTNFVGDDTILNEGNFYEPTVISVKLDAIIKDGDDEENDMNLSSSITSSIIQFHHNSILCQTELFGPVIVLIPFHTVKEAVSLANDTSMGLGCSIWTNDMVQAHTVADSVHAGIVWINDHHKNNPSSPWGGLKKESGIGRENGIEAYNEYTQSKSVVINCNRFTSDWFKDPNARYN